MPVTPDGVRGPVVAEVVLVEADGLGLVETRMISFSPW